MKGKEENQNTVRLSTDNKDVTITDVMLFNEVYAQVYDRVLREKQREPEA